MTHDTIVALSVLGVVGQVLVAILILVGLLALFGLRSPLDGVRRLLWGYELWAAFVVAAIATGGSLFYSEIAHFQPCELCWFQRICMYPLSILTLLMAWRGDNRAARYLLPLPVVGAGVSIYHMLIGTAPSPSPRRAFSRQQEDARSTGSLCRASTHRSATSRSRRSRSPPSFFSSDSWSWRPPTKPWKPKHPLPFRRMPSGKRARQQRQAAAATVRTPPPVRSKGVGGVRPRQASPRALAIGGGVVAVVVIAIVLAVVLGGSSKKTTSNTFPAVGSATWPGALQGSTDVRSLFKGSRSRA
jgi:disulfide bond formation protein DsbB